MPKDRGEKATSATRFHNEEVKLADEVSRFLASDTFLNFEALKKGIKSQPLPSGIHMTISNDQLCFHNLLICSSSNKSAAAPKMTFCLVVYEDLQFASWVNGSLVPKARILHITKDDILSKFSEVGNILSLLKNLSEKSMSDSFSIQLEIGKITASLSSSIQDSSIPNKKTVLFLLEQLQLAMATNPTSRRYSPDILAFSLMMLTTSPALYKLLLAEKILCLPSVSHLKRLSSALSTETGLSASSESYLQARFNCLSGREIFVNVSVDEIYCASRIEYAGGKMFGYGADGEPCKTLLVFMINSVAGKYCDTVAMHPISKLDSKKLKTELDKVLETVTKIGFKAISLSADNATPNRRLFTTELSKGSLQVSVPHPTLENNELFLIFDSVHGFKNLFNNFVNKKQFDCPKFKEDEDNFVACFSHIEELYKIESTKPVKLAYKLTDKVLHPSTIERVNVQLSDSLFHESTINALQFYSRHGYPEWAATSRFLQIVRDWWNIVNCRSRFLGQKKRDQTRKPICFDDMSNLEYLDMFSKWLEEWRECEKGPRKERKSLTVETFQSVIQTTKALKAVSQYLIESEGFEFVLLGKFQTDDLEKRFGWYRQLVGANYYVSSRQIVEGEKSIRLRSLVKFCDFKLPQIKEIFETPKEEQKREIEANARSVAALLEAGSSVSAEVEDRNAMFYIAGCLGRSIAKKTDCEDCKKKLLSKELLPDVEEDIPSSDVAEFLQQVTRGGLVAPSENFYNLCMQTWSFFSILMQEESIGQIVIAAQNPREVFVRAFFLSRDEEDFDDVSNLTCEKDHPKPDVLTLVARRSFNFYAKNMATEANSSIHSKKKRQSKAKPEVQSRKISKLQSEN